jgi:hypothetical protein
MKTIFERKTLWFFLLSFAAMFLLSACAQKIPLQNCVTGHQYGFLGGLWHGLLAPFSFVVSIFDNKVAMYAANNTGVWYDFGFVLGAGILFGGSGKASK